MQMENYTEELKKETHHISDEITLDDIKTGKYTVKDLENAGWEEYRDAWTMGYVSRKTKIEDQPVKVSGRGEVYYVRPSWRSTTYSVRVYMRPQKKTQH